MAREAIETSILVIATVVAVSSVSMALIPTVRDLANSYVSVSDNLNSKVKTSLEIILINSTDSQVTLWMKNTGDTPISKDLISMSDLFLTSKNSTRHYSLKDATVSIVNGDGDDYWDKGETLMISVNASLPSDEYTAVFVLYNGVKASDVFSR